MKFLYVEFSLLEEKCFSFDKGYILLYDCVPTFNCLLQQHIPENRTAGSQRDFTGS